MARKVRCHQIAGKTTFDIVNEKAPAPVLSGQPINIIFLSLVSLFRSATLLTLTFSLAARLTTSGYNDGWRIGFN